MKFLVIGLGSIGKRRIRNLKELGEHDIIGFDIKKDRREEVEKLFGIETIDSFAKLKKDVDCFIICTPPNKHIYYELVAANDVCVPFFSEAGTSITEYENLIKLCKEYNIIACPSATFRFNEPIQKIKELIDDGLIGKVITFTYHMGQYLPDWHPYENIKDFYVSNKDTLAVKEMVTFELQWLTWIFGDITETKAMRGKLSSLDMKADVICQLIFRFENGVLGHLLIDVVSRIPTRKMRVVGEEGSIEFDYYENSISILISNTVSKQTFHYPKDMYLEEMRAFLKAINKKQQYGYTLEDNFKVLKLMEEAWK